MCLKPVLRHIRNILFVMQTAKEMKRVGKKAVPILTPAKPDTALMAEQCLNMAEIK